MEIQLRLQWVQGLTNRSKKSRGKNRHDLEQGTRSKANPIPTERFEAIRELKSRDFRTRLEFKRGIEGRAYLVLPPCLPDSREFHRVVSVWHYEGTFLVFPFLASLGKSFFSKNKRAALRRPEFSSNTFARIDCRPWNIELAEKAFILICASHRNLNLIERKK